MRTIAVGLSGGVDSTAAALLLKEKGYTVWGVSMWLFDHQEQALEAARAAARRIGIPHHILDYRAAFKSAVINPFLEYYARGMTPNPCLFCNEALKYGRLLRDCLDMGAEGLALGHYAQLTRDAHTGEYTILRAPAERKDQSYNLYHLTQWQLAHLHFPLWSFQSKDAVRAYVAARQCADAPETPKDSLGICFIEDGDHRRYLRALEHPAMRQGSFIDTQGTLLGRHRGWAHYTLGQKRRLGLRVTGGAAVVTDIDPHRGAVILGTEADVLKTQSVLPKFHCISPILHSRLLKGERLSVDVRLSQWSAVYPAHLEYDATGEHRAIDGDRRAPDCCADAADPHSHLPVRLTFLRPARAPAPGQALVCYQGDVLIGGGLLTREADC